MGGNTESSLKGWETRRSSGGKNNKRVIDKNGVVRPDAIIKDEDTGCWLWQYSCRGTTPQAVIEGETAPVQVRSYLYDKAGRPPLFRCYAGCGNHRCVNPDHVTGNRVNYKLLAQRKLIQDYAKTHRMLGPKAIADELGIGKQAVRNAVGHIPHSATAKRWKGRKIPKQPDYIDNRRWDIFLRVAGGESMQAVATDYKVSRERVRGICAQVEMWLDRGNGNRINAKPYKDTHPPRSRNVPQVRG